MAGELINSYGDLGSSELLRRFGFVEAAPNPHECVYVPPAPPPRVPRQGSTWWIHPSRKTKRSWCSGSLSYRMFG